MTEREIKFYSIVDMISPRKPDTETMQQKTINKYEHNPKSSLHHG